MPRSRLRRRIAIGLAATAALAVAQPAVAADQVVIKPGTPATSFSGTDKNTGATTHNFVSIGTAGAGGQENNPIGSFSINGQSCQLYAAYGSAYCTVNIPPGATVNFTGTTQSPATTFSYCTSDDSGIDNDCNDVTVGGGTRGTVPDGLLAGFVQLDRALSRVINGLQSGTISLDDVQGQVGRLVDLKHKLISNFAGLALFGVPANVVISSFDVVDVELELGAARAVSGGAGAQRGVEIFIEKAKEVKQRLEKQFHDRGKAPEKLLGGFVRLDRKISALISGVQSGKIGLGQVRAAVNELHQEKHGLVSSGFAGQTLFGVPAPAVITGLDVVDIELQLAVGRARQGGVGATHGVEIFIEKAKEVKQRLEKRFHAAAGSA